MNDLRLHPVVRGLFAVVLLVAALLLGLHDRQALPKPVSSLPAPASEEATPDCGLDPPDDDPQQERIARLASLGVERWHAAGIRGKGVKIAVLDTGFRNYRSLLGKALPRQVTVRCFRDDGDFEGRDSQHGILCSEVLHALAPEAELLLATWEPSSPEQFLQAVRWAKQQGARVLSCSIIMPSWSDGEGGGPVHAALAQIVGSGKGPGDMLCFASAGNTARRHWSGPFQNAGDGYHEWRPRCKENRIKPWGEERISVELCCPAECRYQVQVHASPAGIEVGRATSGGPSNRGCAVVRFTPQPGQRYRLKLRHADGPARPFHVVVLGGELDCSVPHGSITFPGDGGEVLAVGAVDAKGQRLAYSSCGPNSLRPKPDFVAPVPFTTLWRDRPFTGTSAAAPQVAGLAALCWSRNPGWTAEQVRDTLRHWAKDLGQPGHDCETGYGQVLLPPP